MSFKNKGEEIEARYKRVAVDFKSKEELKLLAKMKAQELAELE